MEAYTENELNQARSSANKLLPDVRRLYVATVQFPLQPAAASSQPPIHSTSSITLLPSPAADSIIALRRRFTLLSHA